MPFHVHPVLRALEEAEEAAGIIQKTNTALVDQFIAAEAQGLKGKQAPVGLEHRLNGTQHVAK